METIINIKDDLIARGGKEWAKGNVERVYINAELFNEIMDVSFSDSNNKFFLDCRTNRLMREYKGKKAALAKQY